MRDNVQRLAGPPAGVFKGVNILTPRPIGSLKKAKRYIPPRWRKKWKKGAAPDAQDESYGGTE